MVHYYPTRHIKGQSFIGTPKVRVPKQSLSLREILKRYIRREPLPGTNDGIYEERFGDIEKLAKSDIVIQMEKVDSLKATAAHVRKKESDRLAAEEAARKAALPPNPNPTPPAPAASA